MRRILRKDAARMDLADFDPGFIANVENFKRRRALQSYWSLDISSKMFFERALHVRKDAEPVFVTKAQGKNR